MSKRKRARMNNGDDCKYTSVPSSPILSSDVISTVGASSSPDLPFSETNLPSQSAMSPDSLSYVHLLESFTVDSYPEPPDLSFVMSQQEFAPESWLTDLPLSVNAEVEVSDTKVPQGNEGRTDNIRSNDDQLTKFNSLLDGWSEIASTGDYKIKLDSVRGMMQDVNLWWADNYPSPQLMKLMRDMVLGLSHLHDLRIIHRDLKPQNVLISDNGWFGAQLSDMGISRCLVEDESSLGCHDTGCGTSGWRAPEVLRSGGRQTLAMDLFSLGCVLFFCITRGKHPFGDNVVRDSNILDDKKDLSWVEFIPEAHDLILHLLNQEPKLRPKASEVLHHPFFWSSRMRLTFLHDISDEVESEARKGNLDLLNALESIAQLVFDRNWDEKIDKDVMDDLRRHRRMPYDGSCVTDLLRVVRNKFNHLGHAPEKVKAIHGSDPNGLDAYFAKRFPRLLIESYKVVSQNCKKGEIACRSTF